MDDWMHPGDHLPDSHDGSDTGLDHGPGHGLGHDAGSGHGGPGHSLGDLAGHFAPHNPLLSTVLSGVDAWHALHDGTGQAGHDAGLFGGLGDPAALGDLAAAHFGASDPLAQQFDPAHAGSGVIGDPAHDMQVWHVQTHQDTCAIVSQQFILDSVLGHDISENTLMHEAMAHGWYTPGQGSPVNAVGDLLALHGIQVQQHEGASMSDLVSQLRQGHHVIVGVNAEDIWYHGTANDPLTQYPGMPGQQADHAVEVIGVDNSDPQHPMVILNDSGTPDGRGEEVPLGVFAAAWSASGDFMMNTTGVMGHPARTVEGGMAGGMLGGYYNADGTYHYDSDNTDRDPDTGAIIRRY
jgi:hypothetical protein